ncbi:hypothetical protein CDL12_26500 [Handroanthus impetiginosus]|uniref:Uncharacterized protein n=1 Tax=Handroanthus impetiginosus TaxID=429701 RepID=A0A2G9G773_9LAMI|nr:hypothetical protein CDL12_26500 [Handroanthus impetiginosus]
MNMEEIMANVGAGNSANIVASNKASETSPYYLHSSEHPGLIFILPISNHGHNALAKELTNALVKGLQGSVTHAETAREIQEDLEERFTQGIAPWSLNLIPFCKCGYRCGAAKKMQTMRKEEKVFDFLMGLDEVYSTVRSQFLSIDPLPNLGRAYASAA